MLDLRGSRNTGGGPCRSARGGVLTAMGVLIVGLSGCMSQPDARYIYQDGQFGVIGVPRYSPFGSKNYMKQANELMASHFPQGYEIVRTEEVVEGQRVLDRGKKAEFETDPTISALNQSIKLGKIAESFTSQQKDSTPILESRIIYKRRIPGTPSAGDGFALSATLIPENYIDPNEVARCMAKYEVAEAKLGRCIGMVEKRATDPAVKKASGDPKAANEAKASHAPCK